MKFLLGLTMFMYSSLIFSIGADHDAALKELKEFKVKAIHYDFYIYIEVQNKNLDASKTKAAKKLHEGYKLSEDARDYFITSINNYPFIPSSSRPELKMCDYVGVIEAKSRTGEADFEFTFGYLDDVFIRKTEEPFNPHPIRWVDSEGIIFRVCQLMQIHLTEIGKKAGVEKEKRGKKEKNTSPVPISKNGQTKVKEVKSPSHRQGKD